MNTCYLIACLGLSLCLAGSTALVEKKDSPAALALNSGVVVESLQANFEAEKAGMRTGDIVLAWSRGDRHGEIESPFHLNYLRLEEASRATIKLDGLRGTEKRSWLLGSNYWGIQVRPNFDGILLSAYLEEREMAQVGKLADAVKHWQRFLSSAIGPSPRWFGPWLLAQLADLSGSRHSFEGYDDTYREAIQQAGAADPVVKAELIKKWANGFRARGDLNSAQEHYEEAIAVYRTLGSRTMAVSNALKDLGSFAYRQGNFAKTEECFRESLSIAEELAPHGIQVVWGLLWLGATSQERGDFAGAENYYGRALVIEQEFFQSTPDYVYTLQDLGSLAGRRGDLEKSENYYRSGLAIAERFGPDLPYLPDMLSYLAECVLDRGHPEAAEGYETRALSMREKQAPGGLAVASSLRNLGKIARVRGDLVKADEYYLRALAIAEKITPPLPSITRILMGLGYVARDRADFEKAEEYYRRALAIMEKIAPSSLDHAETLADLAGTFRQRNQLDAAAKLYQQAMAELQNETARLGGVDDDRSRYRAQHDSYYREYVDVLAAQGNQELAFQMSDGSRARTLFDALSRGSVRVREAEDSALLQREYSLKQLRNSKSAYRLRLLGAEHTEEQLAVVDREIRELLDQYQQVEADIRERSPGYAALSQSQLLDTKQIQQLMDGDTLLLEYSLGDLCSHVWVVSEGSLTAFELPKRAEIEAAARRVYELLADRNLGMSGKARTENQVASHWARVEREYPKAAMELSRMVLGPVAALLKGKRLVIVSDGALQYIPFTALPVPESASSQETLFPNLSSKTAKGRPSAPLAPKQISVPLIVEHEVVSLPSAAVLAELRRQATGRPKPSKTVAVFADPVFTAADERIEATSRGYRGRVEPAAAVPLPALAKASLSADQLTRSIADVATKGKERLYLSRLIYTRREAEAILSIIPAPRRMKALDFQANRTTATSAELGQYSIVHFATHGLLNNEHPELSGLVLSLVDNRGQPLNGFLDLQDIYNLHLPVDLVVLSACDTALGQELRGEGLVGLTRGFMYAGASRVVASLWSVNDIATSELMSRFYKEMQQRKSRPAAALRAAQIQMWRQRQWTSPYYWAAFQIQGDWR